MVMAVPQQFSPNGFYGNNGGHRGVLRVHKALLGVFRLSG